MDEIRFTLEGGRDWDRVRRIPDFEMGRGEAVIYSDAPDFVVYPKSGAFRNLAGKRGNIVETSKTVIRCPVCRAEGNKTVWKTEHGIEVITCSKCEQYVWVKRDPEREERDGAEKVVREGREKRGKGEGKGL